MTTEASSVSDSLTDKTDSNAMWGGRFAEGPSAIMREINASIPFDKALWRQDIAASKAHVAMLGAQGIVSAGDAVAIADGLDRVAAEYEANGVPENWDLEDIHMVTESRLAELIGAPAGRLHTGRLGRRRRGRCGIVGRMVRGKDLVQDGLENTHDTSPSG